MKETPENVRKVMAIVVVITGLLMVVAAPIMTQIALDAVLENLSRVADQRPALKSGLTLFSFFYPFLRALIFVGGAVLLAIAYPLYKGEEWTYGVALLMLALPAIGGMYMLLPFVSFVKDQFPITILITLTGLAGYWTVLLLKKANRAERWAKMGAFTFMGMSITHSLTIGTGCLRQLMTRPNRPFFDDVEWWILTLTGEAVWIAATLLLVALPLLANRKQTGWWLAVIGSLTTIIISVPTQIIRTSTLDYMYGSLLSVALFGLLVTPVTRKLLLGESGIQTESASLTWNT